MSDAGDLVVRHVVVGPPRHGVVLHGSQIAAACGQSALRFVTADQVRAADLAGADVVHVPFSDRLFGDSIEAAVLALTVLAETVRSVGAALSLTLHDIPHDDSPLQRRRARGYAAVVGLARGIVVNSAVELAGLGDAARNARSVRMIPLPIIAPVTAPRATRSVPAARASTVGILGYLYPDRGYEDVLAAMPGGSRLLAIGEPSAGHDALVPQLAEHAREHDVSWQVTGHVPEDELADLLAVVDVAVAPNRRVTASASINTWVAHARRVLVPDSAYSREVDRARPHTVELYDPDEPADLRRRLGTALADKASTRLAPHHRPRDTMSACAQAYREHLLTCAPARAIRVGPRRFTVPNNRWDLVPDVPAESPHISVIVPYYEAQADLDRLLTALTLQTHPHSRLEVVVADDGSAHPPDLGAAADLTCTLVRQPDHGFRAAAARNLGVSVAAGDVLAFLDTDMVPEPGYLEQLCRLPASAPDVLTVGRRTHARLDGWSPERVRGWLLGERSPEILPEPRWLREEYVRTRGLLEHVDVRSYRYVISAVMALHRELFEELSGFDESFTSYGGEDWEFAHRAYVAGAVLSHTERAVAWHNGTDWSTRWDAGSRRRQKEIETARLADLVPDPVARGAHRNTDRPGVIVELAALDAVDTAAVMGSARAHDCAFWHPDAAVVTALALPTLFAGTPPKQALRSAYAHAYVTGRADLAGLDELAALAETVGEVRSDAVVVVGRRLANREARWSADGPPELRARLIGRHDVA